MCEENFDTIFVSKDPIIDLVTIQISSSRGPIIIVIMVLTSEQRATPSG